MFGLGFKVRSAVGAFKRDRSGNVAMMWGLMGIALIGLVGITVDFTRAQAIRTQLQNAADGAALAAARAPANLTMAQRTEAARAYFESEAGDLAAGSNFTLTNLGDAGYRASASNTMPGGLSHLVRNEDWTIRVNSEAVRGGVNLEVAMVLDTTGSMAGTRISDLRSSAGALVDIIVQTTQTPYYSRMSLVTYANGVNVGSYAAAARGSVTGGKSIANTAANLNWLSSTQRTITNIAKAGTCNSSTCVLTVTSASHGYSTGDRIYITGVAGMTQVNNTVFIVNRINANSYSLNSYPGNTAVNGRSYTNYSSAGATRTCVTTGCELVFTSNNHGFSAGDYLYITGVNGMAASNGGQAINNADPTDATNPTLWRVGSVVSSDAFSLSGSFAPNYAAYTSGGTAYCMLAGCQYYRFTNPSNRVRVFQISTCVTERVNNDNSLNTTDVAPSTLRVGRQYPVGSNPCDSSGAGFIPLTTDRTALQNRINGLTASGSTSGHVGAAWGWYSLSPNFGSIWSGASGSFQPAAYGAPETQKIVVLMTDGAFNSPYCNGVIANNAISGSGSASDHINCNSPQSSANQTIAMCNAMKAQGVIVYTIGFHIENDATATNVMSSCATSSQHYKSASDGAALLDAFRQIGQSISQLRLTH